MIIGFTGFKGSGKDTAGNYLCENYGFTKIAFADPLREMAEIINPIVGGVDEVSVSFRGINPVRYRDALEEHGYQKAKDAYPEIRRFLQVLGTEAGREVFGKDVWVNLALSRMNGNDNYCFTDTRFPNEAAALRDRGGVIVRINRGESNDNHPSERMIDEIESDYVIDNMGGLNYLYLQIDELMGGAVL